MPTPEPEAKSPQRTVFGIGSHSSDAAMMIARNRGAAHVSFGAIGELCSVLGTDVEGTAYVAVDFDDVTSEQLLDVARAAAVGSPKLSLGFLYGRGAQSLKRAAERLGPEPTTGTGGVQRAFNKARDTIRFVGARLIDGNREGGTNEGIAQLLTEPVELAFMAGHSNGIDMSVGGVLLCTRPSWPKRSESFRALPCFHGEPCARSRYGSTKNEVVMATSLIGAKRLILLTCYGATPSETLFDPRCSIVEGAFNAPGLYTLVTTTRSAASGSDDAAAFYYLCNVGMPLGQVTNCVNARRLRCGVPVEYLCFGDPETRIATSVIDVDLAVASESYMACIPRQLGLADVDLRILLPRPIDPSTHVLLDDSPNGDVRGLLMGGDQAFLTVPVQAQETVSFRAVEIEEFRIAREAIRRIAMRTRFLDRCRRGATLRLADGDQQTLSLLGDATAALSELLESWPISSVDPGSSISSRAVAALYDNLLAHLYAVADALLLAYLNLARELGAFAPASLWQRFYDLIRSTESVMSCIVCGQPVDIAEWEVKIDDDRRQTSYCRTCGPIADGNDLALGALAMEREVVLGRAFDVSVRVHNPYCLDLLVSACVVVPRFVPGGEMPEHAMLRDAISANDTRSLSFQLRLPNTYPPGIHYVCVVYIIGADVTFRRTPIVVVPNTSKLST